MAWRPESAVVSVGVLNVRSMNNKTSRIRQLIMRGNLDVFCSTETWLTADTARAVLAQASPPGFASDFTVREDRRGGGVAVQYSAAVGRVFHTGNANTFQYVATILGRPEWGEDILLVCVYRAPGQTQRLVDPFLDEVEELFREMTREYRSVILTGDFNVWVEAHRLSNDMFHSFLWKHGLTQHVWQDQRGTQRSGHVLDLLITRNVQIWGPDVRQDGLSDHYTLYFQAMPTPPS